MSSIKLLCEEIKEVKKQIEEVQRQRDTITRELADRKEMLNNTDIQYDARKRSIRNKKSIITEEITATRKSIEDIKRQLSKSKQDD